MVYYNEFDPFAAAWLRALIAAGELPAGDVDERSIADVRPSDLAGYRQCHFFAGIGAGKRIEHLETLLRDATDLFFTDCTEAGSSEWVWLALASAAIRNQCMKCSSACDEEGECVSPECCFGRSKIAQVNAAKGEG